MPLKASPDAQAQLLDLQAIDTKLRQLDHRAQTVPQSALLIALDSESEQLAAELATASGAVEDAEAELARVESDVAVVQARAARDTERMHSTSSTKDVAGFESELATLRKRQFDLEEIQLGVMERLEQLQAAVQDAHSRGDGLAARRAVLEAELQAERAAIEGERAHAIANRSVIVSRLPAELVALYERQRDRYGFGASLLRGGVSSASGVKLNEADMASIRAAAPDDVVLCPDSSAILVRTAESGL